MNIPRGWKEDIIKHNSYTIKRYITSSGFYLGHGVQIEIFKHGDNTFTISTSGAYLYIKPISFKTLSDAQDFVVKIMKYINYGRYKLRILDERVFSG